jgi:DNA polymerase-3 subunit alpha
MSWVRISDQSGSCEITLFSEVLSRCRPLVSEGTGILATADLQFQGEALRITAQDVSSLDQAAASAGAAIRVWLAETASVPHIRDLLSREGPGKGRVFLLPQVGDSRHVEIALPGGFQVTPRLAEALKSAPGVERVEDV